MILIKLLYICIEINVNFQEKHGIFLIICKKPRLLSLSDHLFFTLFKLRVTWKFRRKCIPYRISFFIFIFARFCLHAIYIFDLTLTFYVPSKDTGILQVRVNCIRIFHFIRKLEAYENTKVHFIQEVFIFIFSTYIYFCILIFVNQNIYKKGTFTFYVKEKVAVY